MQPLTETKTIILSIPGKPLAKKRPRFVHRSKTGKPLPFVKTINPQRTEEGKFLWYVKEQLGHMQPLENAIAVNVTFYMPIPKGTSKKKHAMMLLNQIPHIKKPDIDNLIKFTLDCLNGVVFKDDTQVISIDAQKLYSNNPRTEIEIMEV